MPAVWRPLAVRSHEPELMDGPGLGDTGLQARVLADLAAVNRLTRTHEPVLQFLRDAWSQLPPQQVLSVLDVGCGEGDLLRAIWRLASQQGRTVTLRGLDLHPDSVRAAQAATPPAMAIDYGIGDVLQHVPPATDLIVSAQLAHHLDDAQIVALLRWLQRHARIGWCIADLRRHWFPYFGFRWLARVAGWHRVVRIDGTRSIAKACTPVEWQALLAKAGVQAQVRCHVPFRLTVAALPSPTVETAATSATAAMPATAASATTAAPPSGDADV